MGQHSTIAYLTADGSDWESVLVRVENTRNEGWLALFLGLVVSCESSNKGGKLSQFLLTKRKTDHFLFVVAQWRSITNHNREHTHAFALDVRIAKSISAFDMLQLHDATLKRHQQDLVEVPLCCSIIFLSPSRAFSSLTCSWWPSCSGLLRLDCGFVDRCLGASEALARKEDSATGKVALQAPGRLQVNAQCYRISQVASGVCGGRVRGEAAGLIEARRGRRDPGQTPLFAVRGALPSWVTRCPGG